MAEPHVHVPHELTEHAEQPAGAQAPPRAERALELGAVLLLSLTTLATAWSGYQAARWSGEQSSLYTRASAARVEAGEHAGRAGQLRIDDLIRFNDWLDARAAGHSRLAELHERRFRAEFRPAFRAWLAQRPFTNPRAVPGPLYMPQYRLAEQVRATALEARADRRFEDGGDAKANDDHYVLSTVFFAAVLFFAGISLRLDWRPLRVMVLGLGATMLLGGLVFVLSLPVA
ncbi:MAG TPA: hypothetical protein VGJ70_12955 [Solirubrobacteraceae bacterium]